MVDNDLFSKLAPRWKKAARAIFRAELTDEAVDLTVQAAASSLRESGCEALRELASIASSLECAETTLSSFEIFKSVREVEQLHPGSPTGIACDVLRKLIISSTEDDGSIWYITTPQNFTCDFVIDYILQYVSPAEIIDRLLQSPDWSSKTIIQRRQNLQHELRKSAGLKKLAAELVADPSGAMITQLRVTSPKSTLSELLNHPLTA